MPILKLLTTNKFMVKIANQQPDLFLGSLDIGPLFTKISLEKTIEICVNGLFKESANFSKFEFKEIFLFLLRGFFIFKERLYKQIGSVAMSFPLDPTLANALLVYHEKKMTRKLSISI